MAEVKIYRLAYVKGPKEASVVRFSGWVRAEGIDEVEALILTAIYEDKQIIGWEEKVLDTDPL